MIYREIVKKQNPIVFQLIKNAIKNNKAAHAFLFAAPFGVEIENEPKFLIQSLISENAFDTDELRLLESYPDLRIIDGSDKLITKDFVVDSLAHLQSTSLENNAKKILWIKNIENSNKQSLNSLLKFIEEPTDNTYIIMSTNNISQVLDTIKSRAQVITLKTPSIEALTIEFVNKGIERKYAQVIAHIFTNTKAIVDFEPEDIKNYYDWMINILRDSLDNNSKMITRPLSYISKNNYHLALGMFRVFINDIWRHNEGLPIAFTGQEDLLNQYYLKHFNFAQALEIINDFFMMQDYHVNFDLYKTQLLVRLGDCYE